MFPLSKLEINVVIVAETPFEHSLFRILIIRYSYSMQRRIQGLEAVQVRSSISNSINNNE